MKIDFKKLNLRELKKRKIHFDFLIDEIEEISKETKNVDEIKQRYKTENDEIQKLIELRFQERKLKRGKKLLEWFGILTVLIGLIFFIYDFEIWQYFNFGFIKKIYHFIISLPGIVKFFVMTAITVCAYWAAFRKKLLRLFKPLLVFATIILSYNAYNAPFWLLGEEMYPLSLFIVSIVTTYIGYKVGFKTMIYIGLFGIANWFGGATGYWTGCYWFYMKDPMVFIPFGVLFICFGHIIEKRGKSHLQQPFEVIGCFTLFLSLLILSVWGYYLDPDTYWFNNPDIGPSWFIILMTLVCLLFIWIGIKQERKLFFNFGVACLAIDLYTRFFEIFSDWLPRSLFWLIFGASVLGISLLTKKKLFQIQKNFN